MARLVFFLLLGLLYPPSSQSQRDAWRWSGLVSEVQAGLRNLTKDPTTFRPELMSEEAFASLSSLRNINMFPQRSKPVAWPGWSLDCSACEAAAYILLELFKAGTPLWEVEVAISSLCILLEIEAPEVCDGMVHNYGYQVEYIVNNLEEEATAALVCGVFVGGDCGSQGTINDWTIDIPEKPKDLSAVGSSRHQSSGETLRVLQITDVHMDLSYLPGSPTDCGLPCCCLNSTGKAGEGEPAAGYWGDYKCDLPQPTFRALMEHIVASHEDLDYVIYTGDAPAHDVWLQTPERNLAHQTTVLDALNSFFPALPVFLTLGNHEGFPVNSFPTATDRNSVVSGDWLYGSLANMSWAENIDQAARDTFSQNGFYSTLVRPGLRIIGINNNFCVGMNFLMMMDFSDPADQLAWMVQELLKAEEVGEKVHILAHHPPSSCLPGWAREYTRVINRFQATITAQFHGHTHTDWFLVFHNESGSPSNTAFVGPSVTPYTDHNPEYRIYTVDANPESPHFGLVLDHETWSMDLSSAETESEVPVWSKLYSASSSLGLAGPSPQDWLQVLRTADTDPALFQRMVRYHRQDREGELPDKKSFLCDMVWNAECTL